MTKQSEYMLDAHDVAEEVENLVPHECWPYALVHVEPIILDSAEIKKFVKRVIV